MSLITIDGHVLKKFIIEGAHNLSNNKDIVDALNVFPVPDGDTGTNMSLTVIAAAVEVEKMDTPNICDIAKAASNGSLRGARGNSGVILSQLFRGFAKSLEGKETANCDDIAFAFAKATETAYKAVMKPKEGTILTIASALSERAKSFVYQSDNIEFLFDEIIKYANKVLLKTTDMLPALKQAGVVDAGGKGLLCFIEGGHNKRNNNQVIKFDNFETTNRKVLEQVEYYDIKFIYCTEFFILSNKTDEKSINSLKSFLKNIGDSIVVVNDDNIIKVHVHTNNPGKVIERALLIGDIDNVKIENMKIQHTNRISFSKTSKDNTDIKEVGFVVVSIGQGINDIFKSLGADQIIEGGQTMNPSTNDILEAVKKVSSSNVIILPNNKNIILAAEQAADICEDKNIIVIPTQNIPQGFAALINYMPTDDIEQNIEDMNESIGIISCGQVTFAVRDNVVNGMNIKKGDFICILNDKIEIVEKDYQKAAKELAKKMIENNSNCGFISIYYGKECSEEKAYEIVDFIQNNYNEIEVEVQYGGQPLYYYIISAE